MNSRQKSEQIQNHKVIKLNSKYLGTINVKKFINYISTTTYKIKA